MTQSASPNPLNANSLYHQPVVPTTGTSWKQIESRDPLIPPRLSTVALNAIKVSKEAKIAHQIKRDGLVSKHYDQIVREHPNISEKGAMAIANQRASLDLTKSNAKVTVARNGLPNLGNSCYLNTCVQLLASSDSLTNCLKNGKKASPLREPLFTLIAALKNPATPKETTNRLVKEFRAELMKSDWNTGARKGETSQNDTMDLLGFLDNAFGSNLLDHSKITKDGVIFVSSLAMLRPKIISKHLNHLQKNEGYSFTGSSLMVTIERPDKNFTPESEITIGEDTYILSSVVRRPNANHYVLNEKGVSYNDSQVVNNSDTSYARALFYTRVRK